MSILIKADKLVNGDRQKDYGDPKINHMNIAYMWDAYLTTKYRGGEWHIEDVDVVAMMMLVKMVRLMQTSDHEDSKVDLAGYAWVWNECAKAQ